MEDDSKPRTEAIFEDVRKVYPEGVPNLFRSLAVNPSVLSGFVELDRNLSNGVLCETERLLVALTTALDSECDYCRAALSKEAVEVGATEEAVAAVLGRARAADRRIDTLLTATRRIVETKGRLPLAEIAHYKRCGLDRDALLEIIAVVSEFTMATYANNLLRTRVDPEYRGYGH